MGGTATGSGWAVGVVVAGKYVDGEPGIAVSDDSAPGEAGTCRDGILGILALLGRVPGPGGRKCCGGKFMVSSALYVPVRTTWGLERKIFGATRPWKHATIPRHSPNDVGSWRGCMVPVAPFPAQRARALCPCSQSSPLSGAETNSGRTVTTLA
jgi:hypothetical protein